MSSEREQTPDVSVLIPVYNTAKYLDRALDSLFAQTHKNLEIIAIDDASPDNAAALVQARMASEPRLKLVRLEQNSGTFTARRHGIAASSGKYIMNLDADDTLDPDAVESLLKTAEKTSADIVGFGARELEPDGTHGKFAPTLDSAPFVLEGRRIFDALFRAHAFSWSLCLKMVKRDLFLSAMDLQQDQYCIFADDFLQCVPVAFLAKKMVMTGRIFYNYFKEIGITGSGRIRLESFQKAASMLAALRSVRDLLTTLKIYDEYASAFTIREREQFRMLYKKWRDQLDGPNQDAALQWMRDQYGREAIDALMTQCRTSPEQPVSAQHFLRTESCLWYAAKRLQGFLKFRRGKVFHDC